MTIFHTEHDVYWRKEQKYLKRAKANQVVVMPALTRELQEFLNRGWTVVTSKTTGGGFSTTYILQIDRKVLEARR